MHDKGQDVSAGWVKHPSNPVLGGALGTCFDLCLLKEPDLYRMWFSWRPERSIALTHSHDGVHWASPSVVLRPLETDWEVQVNRPCVVRTDTEYLVWYTSQNREQSAISFARSRNGIQWERAADGPVLRPTQPWEGQAVMCPHVNWDRERQLFRMWYSAGEQYEPDAIGHATSPDGEHWTRTSPDPVFSPSLGHPWESHKVTACQVIEADGWFLMFYIGFKDTDHARIGIARSRDGVSGWERHPANPIISPDPDGWDADACYKPFALYDAGDDVWRLWYNGRRGSVEQIGLALHKGKDLGF